MTLDQLFQEQGNRPWKEKGEISALDKTITERRRESALKLALTFFRGRNCFYKWEVAWILAVRDERKHHFDWDALDRKKLALWLKMTEEEIEEDGWKTYYTGGFHGIKVERA